MKQCDDIIELLEDTSFPQMLLIDGAWGSGKTYFVKNCLISALTGKFNIEVIFFSLYGISSIEDFRDKLISLSLTENPETSSLAKYFGKIVDGAGNNFGERGLGAILSGAAGAYKYKLYSEFDNVILILDDLERVGSDSLKRKILGECLSLVETKNIKSIVVANEDKISCKDDIEKVFVDKYKFGFSHEEIVSLLIEEYKNVISGGLVNELFQHVTAVGSTNIRVLKRAIIKFSRVKGEIDCCDGVFYDQAYSIVLGLMIRIGFAKYECGYSKDEILGSFEKKVAMQIDPDIESDATQKELERIFDGQFYTPNERLIDYCCDGLYESGNVVEELQLPKRSSLLDDMRSLWRQNELSEEDFEKGNKLLRREIENCEQQTLDDWFALCDLYLYMIKQKIIDGADLSRETIISLCKDSKPSDFSPSIRSDYDHFGFDRNFWDDEVKNIYVKKRECLDSYVEDKSNEDFLTSFKESWFAVSDQANQKLMHKPIFDSIGLGELNTAFKNWTCSELFRFRGFVNNRYKFSNIEDFFSMEERRLGEYVVMISELIEELGIGRKVGCLIEIRSIFDSAHSRLKKNISKKNGS